MLLITGATLIAAWLGWQPAPLLACRALDGDTIRCGETRIRLIGLDAPELRARCEAERRLAAAATERLGTLLEGGVRLSETGEDRFGRTLAVVRNAEGEDLAAVLIREGLARAYHGRGPREGWC
ncbi:thermonuclease family protein [Roseococcus sp. SDR]|uniref:thermonuclease family protein n=1 Tax=Roseococcus sp. SDR TaxID=2835532 RepID=UPI001BCB21F8|nr:thermonuclease family protein [Roseococcus sp. SDR]MBS7788738.1 thermonuclease family protein [Roseococcus sp. SDR]MBV1844052.1 thermonuclease family protein [Roseococcus sp. SDR]